MSLVVRVRPAVSLRKVLMGWVGLAVLCLSVLLALCVKWAPIGLGRLAVL